MIKISILSVLFAVVLIACDQPEPLSPKAQTIADLMTKLEAADLFNGIILIAEEGEVSYKGVHGHRSFNPREPLKSDDAFRVGSISKPVTAVAIHMLAERGQLGYDDALSKFFPELPYDHVTIENLLSHTSGLYDVYQETEMRAAFYAFYDKLDPPYTNKDYLEYMIQSKPDLIGAPLEIGRYSNTGYVLLALIVEQVSGQRFDVFIREHIFEPAGMTRSGVYSLLEDRDVPYIVSSYRIDPEGDVQPTPDPNAPRSMYGLTYGDDEMYTTVDDLLAFDQALRNGTLLKPASFNRMMKPPTLADGSTARYGQGMSVQDINDIRYVTHTGSAWSFLAYWKFATPDNDHTVIIFSNVRSQRNTFRAVYTAINNILHNEAYDLSELFGG